MTGWIRVKDRTPSHKDSIAYAYTDKGEIREDLFFHDGIWNVQSPMDYWGAFDGTVTHYMLRPEPPNPPEEK